MNSNQILDRLWNKYYTTDGFSDVTSTHWEKFGEKIKNSKIEGSYKLKGYGFGNHQRKNVLNVLKTMPEMLMLRKVLRDHSANPETVNIVKKILNSWDINFGFSHLKNLLSFELLNSYGLFNKSEYICIIGDGYGFLGTLIKKMFPKAKIIFINLGRILLFDAWYYLRIFPEIELLHLQKYEDKNTIAYYSNIFLEAEQYELMKKLPISLFINIASLQEMDMTVIQKYFEYMRTSTSKPYFYCCNREEKILFDGSVIRFRDYPWGGGEILLDELCPWYQKYPNWRPPFWRPFEPHRHRLVKL